MKFSRFTLFLALLLVQPVQAQTSALVSTAAQTQTPWLYEGSDVPVDASWTFGTLSNGLRYAVKHNDVPAGPSVDPGAD